MRRTVSRTIPWADGRMLTLRVVEDSYEDNLLQRMAGPPRPKPVSPPMSFRDSVRAWYYQLRWLVLLTACQVGTLGYVFWSVHRMVHGS